MSTRVVGAPVRRVVRLVEHQELRNACLAEEDGSSRALARHDVRIGAGAWLARETDCHALLGCPGAADREDSAWVVSWLREWESGSTTGRL